MIIRLMTATMYAVLWALCKSVSASGVNVLRISKAELGHCVEPVEDETGDSSILYTSEIAKRTAVGLNILMKWYDWDRGLWAKASWSQSANFMIMLADYSDINENVLKYARGVFNATYNLAPHTLFGDSQVFRNGTNKVENDHKNFITNHYDDEGWWALAWIKAYDVTGDHRYIKTAAVIFENMKAGRSKCGGIWRDAFSAYESTSTNELYIAIASYLANRADRSKALLHNNLYYREQATGHWAWFVERGFINCQGTINDGLTESCQNNDGRIWTYNQGTILGALVELNKACPHRSYTDYAYSMAHAAIDRLSFDNNGILADDCEASAALCGTAGPIFKGIFIRNLRYLYEATRDPFLRDFILKNAESIIKNDVQAIDGVMGLRWAGPIVGSPNPSTHSAAMDALVAAVAIAG